MSDKTDGQVDFPPALSTARTSVPSNIEDNRTHFNPVWDDGDGFGQDDASEDDVLRQAVPNPGGNKIGTDLSFDSVAPYHMGPAGATHTGTGGSGHGGFALGPDRPD